MNPDSAFPHWIVTADARRASLYICRRVPQGRVHVDLLRTIENAHEDEHEHHRPCVLGRGPAASAAQHCAAPGHGAEEESRRFAREFGAWLGKIAGELNIGAVSVFAPPKFLGVLREEGTVLALNGGTRVNLRDGELTHLKAHELAVHPAVEAAVLHPRSAV